MVYQLIFLQKIGMLLIINAHPVFQFTWNTGYIQTDMLFLFLISMEEGSHNRTLQLFYAVFKILCNHQLHEVICNLQALLNLLWFFPYEMQNQWFLFIDCPLFQWWYRYNRQKASQQLRCKRHFKLLITKKDQLCLRLIQCRTLIYIVCQCILNVFSCISKAVKYNILILRIL